VLFLDASGDLWGAQRVVRDLALHCDHARYAPLVVTLADGTFRAQLVVDGTPAVVLPAHRMRQPIAFVRAILALRALAERHGAHILHANGESMLVYAWLARLGRRRSIVWHVHDPLPPRQGAKRLEQVILRWLSRSVDTICTMPEVERSYLATYPSIESREHLVPPGIEEAEPDPGAGDAVRAALDIPPDTNVVTTMARLQRHKGHVDLIAAAHTVLAHRDDTTFLVTGDSVPGLDDGLGDELRRLAADGPGADRIRFLGFVDDEMRNLLLGGSTLLAHPAVHEPFGLVVAEAMIRGTPVVAAAAPGPSHLIDDGQSGVIVPVHDPEQLATQIERLIDDKSARDALSRQARDRALDRFTTRTMVEQVERIWDELVHD
jgi:glycosyltransferase involved in cell wall biosynthesis